MCYFSLTINTTRKEIRLAIALHVFASTLGTEFMATPASHIVTTTALLNPRLTSAASHSSSALSQINRLLLFVVLTPSHVENLFLAFVFVFTGLASMS